MSKDGPPPLSPKRIHFTHGGSYYSGLGWEAKMGLGEERASLPAPGPSPPTERGWRESSPPTLCLLATAHLARGTLCKACLASCKAGVGSGGVYEPSDLWPTRAVLGGLCSQFTLPLQRRHRFY